MNNITSNGRVVRTSALGAIDLGLIPSRVNPMLGIHKVPVWRSARDSVEDKPASSLVVPLGKALSGILPTWCGRQMACNF